MTITPEIEAAEAATRDAVDTYLNLAGKLRLTEGLMVDTREALWSRVHRGFVKAVEAWARAAERTDDPEVLAAAERGWREACDLSEPSRTAYSAVADEFIAQYGRVRYAHLLETRNP
jgi:hypothetical protein